MTTLTFLKQDQAFTYDDFNRPRKVAQHLRELTESSPAISVLRKSGEPEVQCVLVSKAWWDEKFAAYAVANPFSFSETKISDSYAGKNFSKIVNFLRGRAETKDLVRSIVDQGLGPKDFKVFAVIDSAAFYKDDSGEVPMEPPTQVVGTILGYVLHPAHYGALSSAPALTLYVGTGDGVISSTGLHYSGAVAEIISVVATSPTTFTVTGSMSGALGLLTTGALFDSPQIALQIEVGATPFIPGDAFTITSVVSPPLD
jgi:hypothetical protein